MFEGQLGLKPGIAIGLQHGFKPTALIALEHLLDMIASQLQELGNGAMTIAFGFMHNHALAVGELALTGFSNAVFQFVTVEFIQANIDGRATHGRASVFRHFIAVTCSRRKAGLLRHESVCCCKA